MNLFELIAADPACTAILGTNPTKFFEFGTAPALEQPVYATWQIISGEPFNVMEGTPSHDMIEAQIDVWAPTAAAARSTARAIRRALDRYISISHFATGYDPESELYRVVIRATYMTEV